MGTLFEGFQSADPTLDREYNTFLTTYTEFCTNWQKGIISAIAADTPQESSNTITTNQPPQPSTEEMNLYITQLSQKLGKPLPPICGSNIPGQIDSNSISQILQLVPSDTQPIINALVWMNDNLSKAISNLNVALQGQTEGFEDTCQDVSECIENNPQLAQQIAQQIAQQNSQSAAQQEQKLLQLLQQFNADTNLQQALQTNQTLIQKSQQIQSQAQSGELLKQVNIPGQMAPTAYIVPEGGNKLSEMKEKNPQQYADYQKNYGQWFSIKQLMEQINSTL